MSEALLELRQVSKSYGTTRVLTDIDLKLQPGSKLAILGPSGCGKSTLLRLIAGLDTPLAGEIRISGTEVTLGGRTLVAPHQRGIAMVFQDLGLWPNLTAAQNVALGNASKSPNRVNEVMKLLGIAELAERKPAQLSGGQQQRVALGAALVSEPKLLLLDEPFTGLDWLTKERLLDEIKRLVTELKISVVILSHDPHEARHLCETVLRLEEARVKDFGTWESALKDPASLILKGLASDRS